NLRPTYLATKAVLPHLVDAGGGAIVCVSARAAVRPFRGASGDPPPTAAGLGGGAIVCVSARAPLRPFRGASGYATAKAAVLAFSQAVAVEYRAAGVRCNAVLPSAVDTQANPHPRRPEG